MHAHWPDSEIVPTPLTDEEKKELEDDAELKKAAEEFEAACKKAAEKNL